MPSSLLLNKKDMDRILSRMAHEIIERSPSFPEDTVLVGIHTRGVFLAKRLKEKIQALEKTKLNLGTLDITFHRDDLHTRKELPRVGVTDISFSITEKTVVLIDDVLYTGRTVRAALDELIDLGRPKRIELAVLIDRGYLELPIKADYVGKTIATQETDQIKVHLKERDSKDEVLLLC